MRAPLRDGLALTFASLFPLLMAWLYFVVLADADPGRNVWLFRLYAIGKLIQFPFPLVYVFLFERGHHALKRPSLRGLWTGIAFGLLVDAAMIALYYGWLQGSGWLTGTPKRIFAKLSDFHVASASDYLLLGAFLSVLHSGLEEYYWRWFVFGGMRRYLPFAPAAVLAGLAFMAHHVVILVVYFPNQLWTLAIPFSLGVAVGGIAWAWLYERSGSLIAPWLSHALVDAGILWIGYDMVRPMLR
jgi:membrane protease YdiL (CAAX protease family)